MSHAAEGATKKYEFIRLTSATSLLPNKLRSCLIYIYVQPTQARRSRCIYPITTCGGDGLQPEGRTKKKIFFLGNCPKVGVVLPTRS